jgi:hypothetical protein
VRSPVGFNADGETIGGDKILQLKLDELPIGKDNRVHEAVAVEGNVPIDVEIGRAALLASSR